MRAANGVPRGPLISYHIVRFVSRVSAGATQFLRTGPASAGTISRRRPSKARQVRQLQTSRPR